MTVKNSGFWWIEENRPTVEKSYQPLYKHIEEAEHRSRDKSSDTGIDFGVDHTVYQM